tara:strand:+ start:580 stop:789 length:210 start_codon:yes stop_codon:yes gene_type:complete
MLKKKVLLNQTLIKNKVNYKKRNFTKVILLILISSTFIPNLLNHSKNYIKKKFLKKKFSKIWILDENDS